MNEPGTSGANIGFTHWEDSLDPFPDLESASSESGDDDDINTDPQLMEELEVLLIRMLELVEEYYKQLAHPEVVRVASKRQRDSKLTGPMWVHWVLTHPNQTTCYERFRMSPRTFLNLCNTLKMNGFLRSSRYVKITEQVAAFCLVMAHANKQRDVADRLQRSLETISKYVNAVAIAMCYLGKTIIQPLPMQVPHPYIMKNSMYYPWFADCVGAIDGTHVKAKLRGGNSVPYRGRKSSITQNVMCVVDFDLCFTYVYAGWEGSAHDSRVFFECINDPNVRFPTPVGDYNYLVDSGYGCFKGFLPPHRNNIYHQEAFRKSGIKPRNAMELFNYRHSSLRSVVERTFGIWKARWHIFDDMPPYPIENQRLFVVACCAVHNFIRRAEGETDPLFKEALQQMYGQDWVDVSLRNNMPRTQYVEPGLRPDRTKASKEYMSAYRAAVAEHMWSTVHGG